MSPASSIVACASCEAYIASGDVIPSARIAGAAVAVPCRLECRQVGGGTAARHQAAGAAGQSEQPCHPPHQVQFQLRCGGRKRPGADVGVECGRQQVCGCAGSRCPPPRCTPGSPGDRTAWSVRTPSAALSVRSGRAASGIRGSASAWPQRPAQPARPGSPAGRACPPAGRSRCPASARSGRAPDRRPSPGLERVGGAPWAGTYRIRLCSRRATERFLGSLPAVDRPPHRHLVSRAPRPSARVSSSP